MQESSRDGEGHAAEIIRKNKAAATRITLQNHKVILCKAVHCSVAEKRAAAAEADEMDVVASVESCRGRELLRAEKYYGALRGNIGHKMDKK